ncbi:sulfurtransferase [Luteitalea sp. TBR-22]|uniref:sulfurtransferase n=1 Tax=Luteitalea sp. TBR-22 TaxID=2802971 RepID=UPI001AF9D6F8|nr:sulfurtransferase [Luteitalea sp. TBR-22]BCS35951.1 sulfurtransferase [Luteitalea sp. TBR-22]
MARRIIPALAISLLSAAAAFAQAPAGTPTFVSASALAADLRNPKLVLLHVGDKDAYAREHIPGAHFVDLSMITTANPPRQNELPAPADLEAKLEALGISDDSRVVVYFGNGEFPLATRVAFTLDYAGLGARTAILDGGLSAWVAAGNGISSEPVPAPRPGSLTVKVREGATIDLAAVRAGLDAPAPHVLDARPVESYTGADDRGGAIKRPGHIPGAVNLPYSTFFKADKTLKSTDDLKKMFSDAGFTPGTPLVSYCTSGVQATVPVIVGRMLGYDVKLFDGSYQEWSASDAPVVKAATPR